MCTHLSYKPFEFKDSSGNVVGFDMDLAQAAAKQLGQSKVTIVDIDFASQTSGAVFAAKKCDMAMGAVTINDKAQAVGGVLDAVLQCNAGLLAKKSANITDLCLQGQEARRADRHDGTGLRREEQDATVTRPSSSTTCPPRSRASSPVVSTERFNDNGPLLDFTRTNRTSRSSRSSTRASSTVFLFQKDDANAAKIKDAFNAALRSRSRTAPTRTATRSGSARPGRDAACCREVSAMTSPAAAGRVRSSRPASGPAHPVGAVRRPRRRRGPAHSGRGTSARSRRSSSAVT